MSELRDTPVKLFGWTITSSSHVLPFEHTKENMSSSSSSTPRLHMINNESATEYSEQYKESKETSANSDDQHSEITTTTTSEEKTTDLKKPDKILPCPRCTSLDTKFCYYNNYNVNQPRHFCRNCQRYWTSGGSMRTVPVGSGRRKNKGWISSEHYIHITSENTSNSSSSKILSFESSESSVTDNRKHHSTDANTKAATISQDYNNLQRLLPQQVTTDSPPWTYQYSPNPSFYHIPVYLGHTVPIWSTLETSTCLGKRTRDETFDDASVAPKNHVWYPLPMKHDEKKEQFNFFNNGSETNRVIPEKYLNLHANPAAMARSMNFRENM